MCRPSGLRLALPIVLLLSSAVWGSTALADERPNILWITAEDLSAVLGCYGDPQARTPHIDRLAAEGVRYTRAYANASVCSPARNTLITGMYATSLGGQHLRTVITLPPEVRPFPMYLREAGYYCTNNVKEDYQFITPPETWDESSTTAHWRNRPDPEMPFFAVFNIMTTHQSRIRFAEEDIPELARLGPEERHHPAAMVVPPYYPDTPAVREDLARLYDLTTAMDYLVGDFLAELEEEGLAEDTIVFFYSDHGTGLPRHKRWLYEGGIHVPLIVHFPEKYRHLAPAAPGESVDRLVSFVDFAPTVLSLAGVEVPEIIEGRAFLGPQEGLPQPYVFAYADRVDEVYDMSRAVTDGRYKLIIHFMPHRPMMPRSTFSEITATRQELRRLRAAGELEGPAAEFTAPTKPPIEFFDLSRDPHELDNLAAGDAPPPASFVRLRDALFDWMRQTNDLGLFPEPEMFRRSGDDAPYTMARQPGGFDERLLDAALPRSALEPRLAMLLDHDAAVRFWAAVGLLAAGERALPYREELDAALADPAPEVRFTAAEALTRLGEPDEALTVVAAGLESDNPYVRLYAAVTLSALGELAEPVLPQIQEAVTRELAAEGDYPLFIRWALGHVLDELGLDSSAAARFP